MRMAEILRAVADIVADADDADTVRSSDYNGNNELGNHKQDPTRVKSMAPTPDMGNDGDHDVDDHNMGSEDDECSTYVPPLQAKIELMKKSEDIPSTFDDQVGDAETTNGNEINDIKTLAGVMKQAMSDEDILDI